MRERHRALPRLARECPVTCEGCGGRDGELGALRQCQALQPLLLLVRECGLLPQGEDLEVVTLVRGQRPAELELKHKSRSSDYWLTEHVPIADDGTARHTFRAVAEPVSFYVRGGDDRTERFRIEVVERPRIKRIVAYYTYPPYAGLPPRKIASGQIRGLEGTQVRIEFRRRRGGVRSGWRTGLAIQFLDEFAG